jgi:hypothetical protein
MQAKATAQPRARRSNAATVRSIGFAAGRDCIGALLSPKS